MLEHAGDMLDGSAAVVVHAAEVMVVHVARVILKPARVLYGAHGVVVLDVGPHGRGWHRGGSRVINSGPRLLGAYLLLQRPPHRLQRPAGLVMVDGGPHRIGGRLPDHRVHGPHGLHRAHRLG